MTETTLSAVLAAAAAGNGDSKAVFVTQGGPVLSHSQLQVRRHRENEESQAGFTGKRVLRGLTLSSVQANVDCATNSCEGNATNHFLPFA